MSKFKTKEAFFIALGGQAPFVSFFIFGGYVNSLLGSSSALATFIAGLLIFVNGLVTNELSKRFPYYGGYYAYSYFTLSSSLSFTTFWTFLLFNVTYALAYLYGTAYMLTTYLFHNDLIAFIFSLAAIMILYSSGRKPTATYAIIAGSLELAIMVFLGLYLLYLSSFNFLNPFEIKGDLSRGILFAAGIPTGYIVLSSIAEEVEDSRKVIGKMMLIVIVIGTLLSAFDLYALSALNVAVIDALLLGLGIFVFPIVLFTAVNDGFLGVMAYLVSTTGLLKSLRYGFGDFLKGKAGFFSFFIYLIIPILLFYMVGNNFALFEACGYLSLLANFFLNAMAAAALLRIGISRLIRKRAWIYQLTISIFSLISNVIIVILNIQSGEPLLVYFFMGWLIIGFVISSIIEVVREIQEEAKKQ